MNFVQPIRQRSQIEAIKRVLLDSSRRDWMLFVTGCNTGLRISDLLRLRVRDVKGKKYIRLKEKKTGKYRNVPVMPSMQRTFRDYIGTMDASVYLFRSRKGVNRPLSRSGAYSVLKKAALAVGLEDIGTHTMRKTFGYWFYKANKELATLMIVFNHSSPEITKRYIGLEQDEIDAAVGNMEMI